MAHRISISGADARTRVTLYVTDCASCGVVFAISSEYEGRRREDHRGFLCPNGHSQSFSGPTEAEKRATAAAAEGDRLRAKLVAKRDQARAAQEEAAAAKASEVRLRWRIGNGVCPCCQRSFPGLAAHVASKHPDFVQDDLANLSTRMRELLAAIRAAIDENDRATISFSDLPSAVNRATLRALESRGLIQTIGWSRVALTEAGWPLAELTH